MTPFSSSFSLACVSGLDSTPWSESNKRPGVAKVLVSIHLVKSLSNLVFYAQSTIRVTSGRGIFCYHTVNVKNVSSLKLVCIQILKRDLKSG